MGESLNLHLDTVAWLIIAIVVLVLVMTYLALALYEGNRALHFLGSIFRGPIDGLREDIRRLETKVEELQHKDEEEDEEEEDE